MAAERPRFAEPEFCSPSSSGYVYVGLSVDPPRAPPVRASAKRDDAIGECQSLAKRLTERDDVLRTRVFEAVLMPPLRGAPRYDVTMLVETSSPDTVNAVLETADFAELGSDLTMPAFNPARIGDTENPADGTYLFNHFVAEDTGAAIGAWKELAGWFLAKTGVDNSTPLQPLGEAPFAFVNYARLPGRAASFLLGQLTRPSFHSFVRKRLKANGMVALPVLYRPT